MASGPDLSIRFSRKPKACFAPGRPYGSGRLVRESSFEIVQKPSAGTPKRAVPHTRGIDYQVPRRSQIIGQGQWNQPTLRQVSGYQVLGHTAPTEAGPQHVQATLQVDKTPEPGAGQAVARTGDGHRVGQDELNMRLKVGAGGRTA